MRASCGVRSKTVSGVRARARSPVARNSVAACSANRSVPIAANMSCAVAAPCVRACVPSPLSPAEPLAVEQVRAREVHHDPAWASWRRDSRYAPLGVLALVQEGLAAGPQPERPGRGGERPFGEGFVRGGGYLALPGPDGGLDQFRQGGLGLKGGLLIPQGSRQPRHRV